LAGVNHAVQESGQKHLRIQGLACAKGRGVDVRLIANKATPFDGNSEVPVLADAGVPLWIDDQARIARSASTIDLRISPSPDWFDDIEPLAVPFGARW
jgi:hypothetical protein